MGVAIVGFVFPTALQPLLKQSFTDKIIQTYREDPDLQNFIDFGQQEVKIMRIKLYKANEIMYKCISYVYINYLILYKNIYKIFHYSSNVAA